MHPNKRLLTKRLKSRSKHRKKSTAITMHRMGSVPSRGLEFPSDLPPEPWPSRRRSPCDPNSGTEKPAFHPGDPSQISHSYQVPPTWTPQKAPAPDPSRFAGYPSAAWEGRKNVYCGRHRTAGLPPASPGLSASNTILSLAPDRGGMVHTHLHTHSHRHGIPWAGCFVHKRN